MNNLLQIYHRRFLPKPQKKIHRSFCRTLGGRTHDFESNKRVFVDMVSVGEGVGEIYNSMIQLC